MTIPLGNSQRLRLNLQVQSLIFVHWKSIFFLPTFEEFGVTRLKSKTFAVQYLGQKSSKLSPKPLVRKFISLSFRRHFDHFWLWQIFDQRLLFDYKQLCIWPLELSEQYEPGNHSKNQRLIPLRKGEYNLIISVSFTIVITRAPNENIVQNHLNITLLIVF